MKSRIDKVLAANGYGTRKDVKRILHTRTVAVNGVICRDAATPVDPERDLLELDGVPLRIRTDVYLMMNKRAGVITSTEDPGHDTVMDLLGEPWSKMGLFPVGRLDLDTEGLLILTNDGPLTHRLTSPKTGVDKTYFARLRDPVDDALFARYESRFREDITFRDGYTCLPAAIVRADASEGKTERNEFLLTIQEGKYHQVKKMFRVVGNEVVYLKRVSMGNLALDPALEAGSYRELTEAEVELLRYQTEETEWA